MDLKTIHSNSARSIRAMATILLTGGTLVSGTGWVFGAAGSTTICKWKDNKTAAFTMSVDDNPSGEAPFIDSVCYPRGIKMTWYLETGSAHAPLPGSQCCAWGGNWDLWRSLAARGHDIGSHTVNHPCLTDLSAAQVRAELKDSKAKIEQEIPNHKCLVIAWPSGCNDETVRTIAAEYYIQGRGTTGAAYGPDRCPASPSTDVSVGNFSIWTQGVMGYSTSAIDLIISWGGWGNTYWHGLDAFGGQAGFVTFCDYIYSNRGELWTGSIREVAEYFYERDASSVQVVSAGRSQIVLNLTHSLSTAVSDFDFPLTLKTEVEAGWDSVTVLQGTSSVVVQAMDESGTKYVYFDVRPNQGQITLTAGASAMAHYPGPDHRVRPEHGYRQVYDLNGKRVRPGALVRPGVYLAGQAVMYKIVVIR